MANVLIAAQSIPTSILGSIPQCVLTCASNALIGTQCTSIIDPCICTSDAFLMATISCMRSHCTIHDQLIAENLQSALCTTSTTATSTEAPSSSTAQTTAATVAPRNEYNTSAIIGGAIGGAAALGILIVAIVAFRMREKANSGQHLSGIGHEPGPVPGFVPAAYSTQNRTRLSHDLLSDTQTRDWTMPPPPFDGHQVGGESVPVLTAARPNEMGAGTNNVSQQVVNDIIGQYAEANRDLISPSLESKLRAARYLPTDDPSEASEAEWQTQHGVGALELKRLKEAYNRSKVSSDNEKAAFAAGQTLDSSRPS